MEIYFCSFFPSTMIFLTFELIGLHISILLRLWNSVPDCLLVMPITEWKTVIIPFPKMSKIRELQPLLALILLTDQRSHNQSIVKFQARKICLSNMIKKKKSFDLDFQITMQFNSLLDEWEIELSPWRLASYQTVLWTAVSQKTCRFLFGYKSCEQRLFIGDFDRTMREIPLLSVLTVQVCSVFLLTFGWRCSWELLLVHAEELFFAK